MTTPVAFHIERSTVTKRTHGKIMRRLMRQMMSRHKTQTLPKHFRIVPETFPGSGGYRYRRRTARYQAFKDRVAGHRIPNVLTGGTRQHVLSTAVVRATQHRATLTAHGTSQTPLNKDRRRELESVSVKERREYTQRTGRDYSRMAARPENQMQRRRRIAA